MHISKIGWISQAVFRDTGATPCDTLIQWLSAGTEAVMLFLLLCQELLQGHPDCAWAF